MQKIKFETMLPDELIEAKQKQSVVYVPIGSMEWHGPHMAMGMDTKDAYQVACMTAERTGGVVLPPLYIGTETQRSEEALKKIGFHGDETIVGMDFPANSLKSMYWPPELFEAVIRQQIKFLVQMGYELIVLMNGHGADRQTEILGKLAEEFTRETKPKVLNLMVLFEDCGTGIGHAGLAETAIMQAVCPEGVNLKKLPPKPQKLYNTRFAIVDNDTFSEGPNEDFSVRYDPRDASAELGKKLLEYAAEKCTEAVLQALA